jgi:hypothetical protein
LITEIVIFNLPRPMSREEVIAAFRATAPSWRENPDLIRKNYLYNAGGQVGGVFTWKTQAAAQKWHGEAWRKKAREVYGTDPVITYYETPFVVDNVLNDTVEDTGD